jgi:hypothetical protein
MSQDNNPLKEALDIIAAMPVTKGFSADSLKAETVQVLSMVNDDLNIYFGITNSEDAGSETHDKVREMPCKWMEGD